MTDVVLGAGVGGLGAALALTECGRESIVLEVEHGPGGLVRTDEVDGFKFDRTGHFLHFKGRQLVERLDAANVPLDCIERRSAVLLGNAVVPYPIQYNLWALEPTGLVPAILEDLNAPIAPLEPGGSFENLMLASWGPTLYNVFFRPYNEKLWGRPLAGLPADCVGSYFPVIDHALAVEGARQPTDYAGYNGTFFYPSSGRLGDAADALAAPLNVRYGCDVTAVDLEARAIRTADDQTIPYETLISTLPLDVLLGLCGEWPVPELFEATRMLNVRIGLRGSVRRRFHWVYVADEGIPIHRIGFPGNVNPATCPEGCASLSVEYTYPRDARPVEPNFIADLALDYLAESGFLELEEVLTVSEHLISPAYVVYRSAGRPEFEAISELLREGGVALAGRFGTWDYLSIEESFESGWSVGLSVGAAAHA